MHDRVAQLVGRCADRLFLGTFHSVCARLLRMYGTKACAAMLQHCPSNYSSTADKRQAKLYHHGHQRHTVPADPRDGRVCHVNRHLIQLTHLRTQPQKVRHPRQHEGAGGTEIHLDCQEQEPHTSTVC